MIMVYGRKEMTDEEPINEGSHMEGEEEVEVEPIISVCTIGGPSNYSAMIKEGFIKKPSMLLLMEWTQGVLKTSLMLL